MSNGLEVAPLLAPAEIEDRTLTEEELVDPVHPYLRIHPDGTVVAYSSQIEMGQGIQTGLATIVAEELDADFDTIRVVNAANGRGPKGDVYANPDVGGAFQLTGASNSMKGFWVRYRLAAAQARSRLVAAAAEAWDVPAAEIEIENSVTRHPRSGKQSTFGELALRAEQLPVPDGVQPKDPADYKLIGREGRLRVDGVPKILGATPYTIDVTLPGMLTALRRGGIPADHIARRTVAFFLLTSLANVGTLILFALGLMGRDPNQGVTFAFAGVAVAGVVIVIVVVPALTTRYLAGRDPLPDDATRFWVVVRRGIEALGQGVSDALLLLRKRQLGVLIGSVGYMAFDIAVLGVCFRAFGHGPSVGVLVVAYIIGLLGGIIPVPGGIGGTEGGLSACSPSTMSPSRARRSRSSPTAPFSCGSPRSSDSSRSSDCVVRFAGKPHPLRCALHSPYRSRSSTCRWRHGDLPCGAGILLAGARRGWARLAAMIASASQAEPPRLGRRIVRLFAPIAGRWR